MGRDDFEAEEAEERARLMKRRPGTFDPALFERLAPSPDSRLTRRTLAVCQGEEPAATRGWCSVWIAHHRHPTWVARALVLLLFEADWRAHPVAAAIVAAFHRMMSFRRSTVQPWWPVVRPSEAG